VTLVEVIDSRPVVTVTDQDRQITIPLNSPAIYQGHSILVGCGGLNAFQVVFMNPADGTAHAADGENPTHSGLVIGIAAESKSAGQSARVQIAGEITNPAWDLEPCTTYYVGHAGTISITPPAVGFWQKIGVSKNATTLIINLGEPILVI
jgi:hypothetical protein